MVPDIAGDEGRMTATELKPRIRPVGRALGGGWIWECRAQRWTDRDGWVFLELYGKRGEGYTPSEAFKDWQRRQ